ncbi:site-specific integrase [Halobium salinum]|uniref:Site-specific integrase n=1 Tax=Halobium salinum TaxID=1364940 RepID=A0ABD5PBZ2_9EURY|nr:site-specific integrase [Halobium salinum]
MDTIKAFIGTCAQRGFCGPRLHELVPTVDTEDCDEVRSEFLSVERVPDILDYLRNYHRASRQHVVFELMWHTMIRISGVRALDLSHYDSDEGFVEVVNQPETGTRLKNGDSSERFIGLSTDICGVIDEYIDVGRENVADEFGRDPLITTEYGRPASSTIRQDVYQVTYPPFIGQDCSCPSCDTHDRNSAFRCNDTRSPHMVRKASVIHHRDAGWDPLMVADRADASWDVLSKHYDLATKKEKMLRRKDNIDDL